MAKPSKLIYPKQLLVEGRDAEAFFYPFLEAMEIDNIGIHNYGSITELAGFLKQFVRNADFRQMTVTSIGIVRDAEESPDAALQSIRSALGNADLPLPGQTKADTQSVTVSAFILPDGQNGGMIETLILQAIEDEPGFACIEPYLTCAVQATGITPKVMDKARFLTYLAAKQEYRPLTGYAARAGYLNFESAVYEPLKAFIRSL